MQGDSLQEVCISNKTNVKYQCILQVCDDHADLVLIIPNDVAEKIFGMSAPEAMKEIDNENISSKQRLARERLEYLVGRTVEGKIKSILMDGRKYFLLVDEPVLVESFDF